jgi:hypothetical protein
MFQQPLDIINRALQRCGLPRASTTTDQSPVQEIAFHYNKLRKAELRRSIWTFATRTIALRALDTTSQLLTFEAYAAGTTYPHNYVVQYNNLLWISLIDGNVGNTPGAAVTFGQTPWDIFFGSPVANAWNDSLQNPVSSTNIAYHVGEMVYTLVSGVVGNIYTSLAENNTNQPNIVDTWSSATLYGSGAVVKYTPSGGLLTNYQSLTALNYGNQPDTHPLSWTTVVTNPTVSGSWVQMPSASLSTAPIVFPVSSSVAEDKATRNAFLKPSGYIRLAPRDPKTGHRAWMGAHVGLPYDDMIEEGRFFTTSYYASEKNLRFIADVTDVTLFDDMFCEGLAARLAMEVAPILAPTRLAECAALYKEIMAEARLVDAIELGPIEQDEDEYITVRY